MTLVIRSVLGAALLLTGASAAMAASDNPAGAGQPRQAGASTTVAASNAPANQSAQTGSTTTTAATAAAPSADQAAKAHSNVTDNADLYGGHDPNSTQGTRSFWESRNQY